jgi:hypothetical protein
MWGLEHATSSIKTIQTPTINNRLAMPVLDIRSITKRPGYYFIHFN